MKLKLKNKRPIKVAVIGSQGVPPQYGGFETLVDNLLRCRDQQNVQYTVFCSSPDMGVRLREYRGARLRYVNLRAHGRYSVLYDTVSMIRSLWAYDAILLLGVSGALFIPVFRLMGRGKIILNVDGLEYKRGKWADKAKKFLKFSLRLGVRFAHTVVADNKAIHDFLMSRYKCKSELIAYGGDHALRNIEPSREREILRSYGLTPGGYDLSICRIEPENNVETTLSAYTRCARNIVVIGNWNHSEYSAELQLRYGSYSNILLLNSVYDLDILHVIRANAARYVHGHSAGGTNPSLVEAMFFGKPILAFDVAYNRETTRGKAYFYHDTQSLLKLLNRKELDGSETEKVAREHYLWKHIADQYERLFSRG